MNNPHFQPALAMREYLLGGGRVSLLEAMLLFGVQNPNAEFARLKKDGFLIASSRVSMAKIVRRINEFTPCQPPSSLPVREIIMSEYWIKR